MSSLPGPAHIDRWADNVGEILRDDAANKQDREVVFHSGEFRIVYSRFLVQFFRPLVESDSDGVESQVGFSVDHSRFLSDLVHNSVL